MATRTKIQGETISFTIDSTNMPVFTSLIVELGKFSDTVLKYSYPAQSGYQTIVKDGNNYTVNISALSSSNLEGLYDLEITYTTSTDTIKGKSPQYLCIEKEIK